MKKIEIEIKLSTKSQSVRFAQWEAVRDTVEQLNPGFVVFETFQTGNDSTVFMLERSA